MEDKKKRIGISLGIGSLLAALYSFDPARFTDFLNVAGQQTVVRDLFLFSVAAWIHSGRVKKEFVNVTGAIRGLGDALREDLGALGHRIEKVEERIESLEKGKSDVQK